MYKYLFGPVLSRRLGLSLGIDLLPYKTCSFDCVYCECGATTDLSLERKEFFPLEEIIAELRRFLVAGPRLDYITFSGSGEPTLYSRISEIISFLKKDYPLYKVALLTNATLLARADIRREIKNVDLCVPSLDSATRTGLQRIDRPDPAGHMDITDIIRGIKKTKGLLAGEMWLEIFIVPGINDTPGELKALKQALDMIKPDKVQVNSLDRPGTESWVEKLSPGRKTEIQKYLQVEILDVKGRRYRDFNRNRYIPANTMKARIISILREKPATVKELSQILDICESELDNILYTLIEKKTVFINKEKGTFEILDQGTEY